MSKPFKYFPPDRLLIFVGNFGSGKTEVSVNLALRLAENGPVRIVDLDIVNPYFRCREAREEMEARGIEVLYPKGEFHAADLPIVLPEIQGAIASKEGWVVLDVGGDDLGARVLSSLAGLMEKRPYAMFQVINACRPFTADVEGCLKIMREIEAASRLQVTGLVSNTHLMEETDPETIRRGIALSRRVSERAGIPLEFCTLDEKLWGTVSLEEAGCPLLPLNRRLLPPWLLPSLTDRAGRILKDDSGRG